ncbi:hypothetical protein MMC18_003994 [Xylographa bjoerkii]|nr:hypothetical protein [Xylographa bjoerkii]
MQFSTSIFTLQALVAFLLFSLPSYAGNTLCIKGVCAGETRPTNCQWTPSARPAPPHGSVPSHRRDLELRLQQRSELYKQAAPPPSLRARGRPFCYYVEGLTGVPIGQNQDSESFVLPQGEYALKWDLDPPSPSTNVYFEVWTAPDVGSPACIDIVINYGGTFQCDGTNRLFLNMFDVGQIGPHEIANVWLNMV